MDLNKIRELTFEYGGEWELNHVDRLLKLIEIIGEDQIYDGQLTWIAAHLPDGSVNWSRQVLIFMNIERRWGK